MSIGMFDTWAWDYILHTVAAHRRMWSIQMSNTAFGGNWGKSALSRKKADRENSKVMVYHNTSSGGSRSVF